jgi:hypothetical protein
MAVPADIVRSMRLRAGVGGTSEASTATSGPGVPKATVDEGTTAVMEGNEERVGFCGWAVLFEAWYVCAVV